MNRLKLTKTVKKTKIMAYFFPKSSSIFTYNALFTLNILFCRTNSVKTRRNHKLSSFGELQTDLLVCFFCHLIWSQTPSNTFNTAEEDYRWLIFCCFLLMIYELWISTQVSIVLHEKSHLRWILEEKYSVFLEDLCAFFILFRFK